MEEWEAAVESRSGFSKAEKKTMLLSKETRDGWKMTGKLCIHIHIVCVHAIYM